MQWGRGTKRIRRASHSINRYDPQYQNLFMHMPLAEQNTRKPANNGWPGHFKSTKGSYRVTVNDPNHLGYTAFDSDIGFRTYANPGLYDGLNACTYRVVYWNQTAGFNVNTKNYITPKKFTAMIWFKVYGFVSDYNYLATDGRPSGGDASWFANWVIRLQDNGAIRYYCSNGTSAVSSEVVSSTGEIQLNKIYLATLTYDGQTLSGYLNNRLIGSNSYTGGIGNSSGCLEIGSINQQYGYTLGVKGSIWDFRMYSAALSKAQVQNVYYNYWKLYGSRFSPAYVVGGNIVEETVTQSVTTSHSIVCHSNRYRSISHTATLSQIYGRAFPQSVTQTVTTNHVIGATTGKFYSKTVSQSFAAYQDIAKRFNRHVTIVQSFNASDLPQNDLTNIRQSFTVSHVVAFNKDVNQRLTQNVITEQVPFINSPRFLGVSQGFTTTDTASGRNSTNRQSINQTITSSQVVAGRNATFRLAISQSFATGYTLYRRDAIIRETITHSVATTQRVNTHWFKRVEQDLNMVDIIDAHRHIYRTFSTSTTIAHTFDKQRIVNRTVGTLLDVDSGFNRQVIYGRILGETLEVQQEITVSMQLSAPQIYLPEIIGGPPQFGLPNVVRGGIQGITPIANLVRLDSGSSTILLPVPQLQNTLGDAAEVVIKRSISGKAQAYKKTTGQQRFTYTFWMDLLKALELRDWVIANGSKEITLTNWRGEAWKGNIITDQPQFTYEALRKGDAQEKVTITLSFQGVKLYG